MNLKFAIVIVLVLIISIVTTTQPNVSAQRKLSPAEQEILDLVAKRQGANASQLKLLNFTKVELPLTRRSVQVSKVLDEDGGRLLSAAIDEQGNEVDFETLKAEEIRAYRERFGKLEPKLHDRI